MIFFTILTFQIVERSSELFSVLIIKRVSLEHCGKYTCIATNHVGKVNQTADLYINGKLTFVLISLIQRSIILEEIIFSEGGNLN